MTLCRDGRVVREGGQGKTQPGPSEAPGIDADLFYICCPQSMSFLGFFLGSYLALPTPRSPLGFWVLCSQVLGWC